MSDQDPNTTPHPNPAVYETCPICDYEYKLLDGPCAKCGSVRPPDPEEK